MYGAQVLQSRYFVNGLNNPRLEIDLKLHRVVNGTLKEMLEVPKWCV